jgi:FdhE protein
MMNIILDVICGDNAECREELLKVPQEVNSLFNNNFHFIPRLKSLNPPLIDQVENLNDAKAYFDNEELAKLAVAHKLHLIYGDKFKDWRGSKCPICGRTPNLFIIKRSEAPSYSGYVKTAKCVCGFSWNYEWWRCPNCGVEGRENFDVLMIKNLSGVFIYRCKRCGYVHAEVYDVGINEVVEYGLRVLINLLSREVKGYVA